MDIRPLLSVLMRKVSPSANAEDETEERDPPDAHDHDGIPDPATFTST